MTTLVLLTALSVLSLNMFLPSLPAMAISFDVDYETISLSIAGYLAVTAILQLLIGPLSDRFGRRPVLMATLVVFVLASVGCVFAEDVWTFLLFRVGQGAIISGWILSLAAVRDTRPESEAASLIGYITMAMAIAPMVGPMIGGLLDQMFGWRSNFILFISLGAVLLTICLADFGETNREKSDTFAVQFLAYPELFRSRRFWGYSLCLASSSSMFYAFLAGIPLVAVIVLDMSSSEIGFYMGTITAGFMFGSFLSGRYAGRYALTSMIITGRILACAGLATGIVLLAYGWVNVFSIFGAAILAGAGNGLTMPSASTGAMSVRAGLTGSAAGLSGALTVAAGAFITSATGFVLTGKGAALTLLAIMFGLAFTGLLAAIYVRALDKREERLSSARSEGSAG